MDGYEGCVGDEVGVESHRLRGGRRMGTILEVMGAPGHEYYRVRWEDGRETIFHPGTDAVLIPKSPRARARARDSARPASRQPPAPEPPSSPPPKAIRAVAGDRLVVRGHRLGERERDAEILEVLGSDGGPPFRVRWADTGRETLLFPGPDALVDHIAKPRRRKAAAVA
jgi:hypothetical protein